MHDLQVLEFASLESTEEGIFINAKYPGWFSGYNFLIEPGGSVKGRSSSGNWLELSHEISTIIRKKAICSLSERGIAFFS